MERLKFISCFFILFLSAFCCSLCKAATEYGLSFYSYDVQPDRRTSLLLPGNPYKGIAFSDSCSVAFDFRIDTKREKFGYICRVVIDNTDNIDIMVSSPYDGSPYICAVSGAKAFEQTDIKESGLDRWNRIEIVCAAEKDSVRVSINGFRMFAMASSGKSRHTVSALFGASGFDRFATSDVAPVSLKDLSFRRDNGREFFWRLSSVDDLNRYAGIRLSTRNPLWISDLNRRWHIDASFSFPSKVFTVPDPERQRIMIISENSVTEYSFVTNKSRSWTYTFDMKLGQISNDFFILPDGRLAYLNMGNEQPDIIFFDFSRGEWERPNSKEGQSRYLHHSSFINVRDSAFVQLFGYGYHKYSNEINIWKPGTLSRKRIYEKSIEPRYLSATALTDSVAYIFGGKGNDAGEQEFGQKIFNDLYVMDLGDYSVKELWEIEDGSRDVAVPQMLVSSDGKWLVALTFCPDEYHTSLQLRKISVLDGSMENIADAIPYRFIDVESEAWLVAPEGIETLFTVISEKNDAGYSVYVYKINTPVAGMSAQEKSGAVSPLLYIGLAVLLAGALTAIVIWKRTASKPENAVEAAEAAEDRDDAGEPVPDVQAEEKRPGVYLLGGFRVIDKDGNDISARFSPLMKQLLSAMVLYSDGEGGGISNTELKEMFWYDKSNDSYINNRGVNIRKIRSCLEEVGSLDIVNSHGKWSISDVDGLCDWTACTSVLDTINPSRVTKDDISKLVSIARHGTLLPEMRLDWVDVFKAQYADKVISILNSVNDMHKDLDPEVRISLADATLVFDPLDENAVRVKCESLISLKRFGRAQKTYSAFTQEYREVMGEEFGRDFRNFISQE